MKRIGRVKLVCRKIMNNGMMDCFSAIVREKEQQAMVSMYKGMGYWVVVC